MTDNTIGLLRNELSILYEQCTEKQQLFFNRMYGSVEKIPAEKIEWAISQCQRTIIKNGQK